MKSKFRSFLAVALLITACDLAQAESQTLEFNSLNGKQGFAAILEGRAQYSDKINGVFTRPANATGNVPVMVIMHGSGGVFPEGTGEWSKFFLEMGIATFVVDSFKPRGIETTSNDQAQLSYPASTVDALTALRAVAKLQGVDAKRIGVIGFSRGGLASTVSGHENIRAAVLGTKSDLRFALHVSLYGGCNQVGTTDGTPILHLMGDNDDYVAPETCFAYEKVMKARGANLELVVYPKARHGFDIDRVRDVFAPRAQTWKSCSPRYMDLDAGTYFVNGEQVTAKESGDNFGKCFTRGLTVGFNRPATTDARARVKAMLLKNFAM